MADGTAKREEAFQKETKTRIITNALRHYRQMETDGLAWTDRTDERKAILGRAPSWLG